jgi:membrane-associated protease RseP (regulator of RpoE activity)
VFIHELGHCLAARRVGGHVDGILLWCAHAEAA